MKVKLVGLEIHAAHTCNLNCFNCCHFSHHKVGGLVSVEEANEWMFPWKDRLYPQRFTIIGGEPTLNPDLCQFLEVTKKNWPESRINIATNGFFLKNHPELPKLMKQLGNVVLVVNKVHESPEYNRKYEEIHELCESWKAKWQTNISYIYTANDRTRRYRGFGSALAPLGDNDYKLSYQVCEAKESKTLFRGCLYKCSRLAYLQLINQHFKLDDAWTDALTYQPLPPTCTRDELIQWSQEKAIPACVTCPVAIEPLENLPNPLKSTQIKAL